MLSIDSITEKNPVNTVKVEDNNDEQIKEKCLDLQNKISKVENDTSLLSLLISRSSKTIKRLRTEYLILLELLERKSKTISNDDDSQTPSSPEFDNEEINTFLTNSISKLASRQHPNHAGPGRKANNIAGKRGPRKVKDPNFPKRPTNAYLLYCEGEKERVKTLPVEEQEKISDLSKHLTEGWKSLDEEGRKPYYKIYEQDKERFARELEEYERKKKLEEDSLNDDTPQPTIAETPEVEEEEEEEEDIVHPLVKKIKLEESQFSTESPQLIESPSETPIPSHDMDDDVTGVEEDDEDEDDEEDEDDVDDAEEDDDDEQDELDEDEDVAADSTFPPSEPNEHVEVDDNMEIDDDASSPLTTAPLATADGVTSDVITGATSPFKQEDQEINIKEE